MKLLRKIFILFFIILLAFPSQTVLAGINPDQDYPSPTEAMDEIMADLGMDKTELKRNIKETGNVADYKKNPPEVVVSFVPESPVPGKKVTAIATPSYFTGNPKEMYFTWFLKHDNGTGAGTDAKGRKTKDGNTDWDEDGSIDDIDDYKIEAMRLLANGGADPSSFRYSGRNDVDSDDDGYDSVFGGEDQKGKPAHCYVRDIESGIDYEMGIPTNQQTPGTSLEFFQYNPDAWKDDPVTDEGISFTLCKDSPAYLSCRLRSTDPLETPIELGKSGLLDDCRQVFELTNQASEGLQNYKSIECDKDLSESPDLPLKVTYELDQTNGASVAKSGSGICGCDDTTISQQSGECTHLFPEKYYIRNGNVSTEEDSDGNDLLVGDPEKGKFSDAEEEFWGTDPHSKDTNNDGVADEEALTGKGMMFLKWTFQAGDQIGVAVEGVTDNTDYKDSSLKTMWALSKNDFNGEGGCRIKEDSTCEPGTDCRGIYRFNHHGSEYSSPVTVSTRGCSGVSQQATETFPNPGGTINTQSYPPAQCEPDWWEPHGCSEGGRLTQGPFQWKAGAEHCPHHLVILLDSDYPDNCEVCVDDYAGNIECQPMNKRMNGELPNLIDLSDININDCLKENFVDPPQGTGDKKIEVSLAYSPKYPINDPAGNNSDKLNINSSLLNIEDRSFVKYEWTFWGCLDKTDEHCTLLNKDELERYKTRILRTIGIGLDSIKMNLQLPTGTLFLKARVRAFESTQQASGKMGESTIFIPLQENRDSILPKKIEMIEAMDTEADVVVRQLAENRYADLASQCPEKVCPVVKNEIMSLSYSGTVQAGDNLAWSLNGKPLPVSENKPGVAYFPILQSAGAKYSVKLDIARNNEKISLVRDFKVEDPKATITPGCINADCISPNRAEDGKFLNPLDRSQVEKIDYNQNLFQAQEASTVTVQPTFNFDSSLLKDRDGKLSVEWFVDGVKIDPKNEAPFPHITPTTGELNIPINKRVGDKYAISMKALYTQPMLAKRALGNIWGVPDSAFYETIVSDSAEIEVIAVPQQTSVGTKKIMASLFSLLPDYINFLFRIVLTIGLILFSTGLLLSVFPKQKERQM